MGVRAAGPARAGGGGEGVCAGPSGGSSALGHLGHRSPQLRETQFLSF